MRTNEHVLQGSLKNFERIKRQQIMDAMNNIAYQLLYDALELRRGWLGFTGNLPTSYAVGIWDFDKKLTILYAGDVNAGYDPSTIIRHKVGRGETAQLDRPWEGKYRSVTGRVDIKNGYGIYMTEDFLLGYRPQHYPALCVCTGAEYSLYLEKVRHGNVLSQSAQPSFVRRVGDMIFAGSHYNARNMITTY